ncbi:HNH endonuclease signature motif containing protein [Antribacter gilvus]|uniref:HNH endonuclease signature motif containing protein n=1 Tax=Antribacter gilvus TaxID=2304675 RepID=UPI000F76D31B|nr:HNH endonuclease signature motif containing protein [Antribacter gilvus]
MESVIPQRAWLLMAAGDNRGHGGNSGYDDQIDAYYSWDSNVPNFRNLAVGDPVALWDKERLLGVSVIEEITTEPGTKTLRRCPKCATTRIAERKNTLPRFRCMKCREEFAVPVVHEVEVIHFRARYDAAWTDLDGLLTQDELRSLATKPGDINAMRPLDWARFREALLARNAGRAVERVTGRVPDASWARPDEPPVAFTQGFNHALVRVRRGQRQFREQLLAGQGSVCAFTGGAPARVLEAGHLYSYAQLGTHFRHGGLMLRRDVHRLFDDGLLAVEPGRLRIDVAPDLAAFPQYAQLHGVPLAVNVRNEQVEWLNKHWSEHRVTH